MPLIYIDADHSFEDLEKLRKYNICSECGGFLALFKDGDGKIFLACHEWQRSHHEGIVREASPYEKEGMESLNLEARRKIMEEQHGEDKVTALEKRRLPTSGALTQNQAMEVLKLVYPEVPANQIIRTAMLCRDFGLHPLMKEVYIIGFKNKGGGVDYSTVIGISASRKMAADKKGAFSFLDDTPRAASHEEIVKQYGEDSDEEKANLVSITKLKGEKGNEAIGFGLWPKGQAPFGLEKGNTKRNMANIRSERQALDRSPGEALPKEFEVIDAAYVEVPDVGKVDKETGEVAEATKPEPEAIEAKSKVVEEKPEVKAEKKPPAKAKAAPPPETTAPGVYDTTEKLLEFVCQARGFGGHPTARKFLVDKCDATDEDIDNNPAKVYEDVKDLIS